MKKKATTKKKMKTLNKRDIVLEINKQTGITQSKAMEAMQIVLDSIADCLSNGGHVEFRDFGVFELAVRQSRVGRNPNKPEETVVIPTRKVVKFKPSKKLKELVLES